MNKTDHATAAFRVVSTDELLDTLLAEAGDVLRPEDRDAIRAIHASADANDPIVMVTAIRAYYADVDRADRTPRHFLYLHLGMLCGAILLDQ